MIIGIKSYEVRDYWQFLVPLIQMPLDRMDLNDMYTTDDVLVKLETKAWQCWVALNPEGIIDAVFITKIDCYPAGRKEIVVYLVGGNNLESWLAEAWQLFKDYGRSNECSGIRGMGRKGWARILSKFDKLDLQYSFTAEL